MQLSLQNTLPPPTHLLQGLKEKSHIPTASKLIDQHQHARKEAKNPSKSHQTKQSKKLDLLFSSLLQELLACAN
jgi:hypothetical protein